jgi:hypothetical protein
MESGPRSFNREKKLKALILLLLCSPVFADDLIYQSQTLTGTATTFSGSFNEGSTPINDVYTVTVTVSGPLAPNLNMSPIAPSSWVVTCQSCTEDLSSSPPTISPPSVFTGATAAVFLLSTDSTGKITNWSFAINGNSMVTDGMGGLMNTSNGSFSSSFSSGDIGTSSFMVINRYTVTTSGPHGTWTQSSLSNPPPVIPPNLQLRTCFNSWGPVSNTNGAGVAPNANGSGEACRRPIYFPPTWYIRTTTDGGQTSEWRTLASLGLGKPT